MEKVSGTKSLLFSILHIFENFSNIGPIIKKIPKFQSGPLNFYVYVCNYNFARHNVKALFFLLKIEASYELNIISGLTFKFYIDST